MNGKPQPTPQRRYIGSALAAILALLLPNVASAYGELLVRITALTRQIEAATNNLAPLYLQRGELHREDQNWAAAEADYACAAQLDPTLPVDLCRAKLLADSGQIEAALAQFEAVIARAPHNAKAFLGRAAVQLRLGRSGEALADLRRALELSTQPPPRQVIELARGLKAQGRAQEALSLMDECVRKSGWPLELQAEALDLELENRCFDAALRRLDAILSRATARRHGWRNEVKSSSQPDARPKRDRRCRPRWPPSAHCRSAFSRIRRCSSFNPGSAPCWRD